MLSDPGEMGDSLEVLTCFEALTALVWVFEGPEHRVVAANRAARASVGNRSGMLGRPARDVVPEVFGQQVFEQLDHVYATGQTVPGREWRILVDSDGDGMMEEIFCDFVLLPRIAEDGSVRGVLAQSIDVTATVLQRGEAEAAVGVEQRLPDVRGTVLTLQGAMLPAGLPVLPQVRLAAQYVVAGGEPAGGGDWFDAVPLGRGRIALSVGDVVGHGAPAVAVMGQLRTVLTEALMSGLPAAEALARLNGYALRVPAARTATACLAVIDPAAGEVKYGGFGHPAPLVVAAAGNTRFLPMPPSGPLGVAQDPAVLRSARLAAGEVLLLYSDGLVQRPGRSLHDGMEDLAKVASAAAWEIPMTRDPGPLADRVCGLAVERLTRSGHADDVAVLAAELRGDPHRPLVLELPAEGRWLRGIRMALDEWLHGVGAAGEDVPAVHLAVVEAATNCIEHAYRGTSGWMWLDAVLDGAGRLRVTVTDHGRWRIPPSGPDHRGRGLRLMHSLMDSVDVHRSDRGTTVTMSRTLQHPAVFSPVAHEPPGAPPTVDFSVEVRPGPRPCLVVAGPVDTTTAGTLQNRISEITRGGVLPLDLDLSAVTYLASAGVQMLYDCTRTTEARGRVRLLAPNGCPAGFVLELTGLGGILEVLPESPLH